MDGSQNEPSELVAKPILKFRSSLFKGLRFPKAEPWSTSAEVEIPLCLTKAQER